MDRGEISKAQARKHIVLEERINKPVGSLAEKDEKTCGWVDLLEANPDVSAGCFGCLYWWICLYGF